MVNQQLLLVLEELVKEKSTLVHLKHTYVFYAFLAQYGRHHI